MKKIYLLLLASITVTSAFAQTGTWKFAPEAQALAVGPTKGDFSWWSNTAGDVSTRDCLFDDEYVFNDDGSFENKLGDETWIEPWQGIASEACATPVAPHDGSAIASWSYDESKGEITITGKGAFLGLSKVANGMELKAPSDAPAAITYPVVMSDNGNTMTIDIDFGGGYWHFVLKKEQEAMEDVDGVWKFAPEAQALAVGPTKGDFSWWSNTADDVNTRDCLFDDEYVFNGDGSFENKVGDETWIEPWQGIASEACATPVAPHDGSAIASWSYDESKGEITITGKGAFLGLSKVANGMELKAPSDAPAAITYPVVFTDGGKTMTIDIDFGGGYWHFVLKKTASTGSVRTFDANLFKIFPNPATDEVSISSLERLTGVTIYDITGKEVYNTSGVNVNQTINVSSLEAGMYIIEVLSENKRSQKRLIIN